MSSDTPSPTLTEQVILRLQRDLAAAIRDWK